MQHKDERYDLTDFIDLKGLGLGSLLLDRLIARCRSRGPRVLTAIVLQRIRACFALQKGTDFAGSSRSSG